MKEKISAEFENMNNTIDQPDIHRIPPPTHSTHVLSQHTGPLTGVDHMLGQRTSRKHFKTKDKVYSLTMKELSKKIFRKVLNIEKLSDIFLYNMWLKKLHRKLKTLQNSQY